MKSQKPKPSRTPRKLPKKAVIGIILLIVLATLIFTLVSYRAQETRQRQEAAALAADQALFAQVEKDMDAAYAAIVASAGKPVSEREFKSCSRVAFKFDEGELWCNVGYAFAYPLNNYAETLNLTTLVQSSILSSKFILATTSKTSADINVNDERQLGVVIDLLGHDKNRCSLRMDYKNPQYTQDFKAVNAENAALYYFTCSKTVAQPVYTLAE